MSTDCIEKEIFLRSTLDRVWRALADSTEFGTWFGVKFERPFEKGAHMRGVIVTTAVNAEVAEAQKEHTGKEFEIWIEQMDPRRLFSFRWHPYAIERDVDYSNEPTTTVSFLLKEGKDGVSLTVTECGFDQIPVERRAKAFAANEGGWGTMIKVIEEYILDAPKG